MPLRDGLEPGRFALFVSTIEPRKGHRLRVEAWRQLLARGVPQRHRFKLVLVGRSGWMVDDLMREIDDPAAFGNTLLHYADRGKTGARPSKPGAGRRHSQARLPSKLPTRPPGQVATSTALKRDPPSLR